MAWEIHTSAHRRPLWPTHTTSGSEIQNAPVTKTFRKPPKVLKAPVHASQSNAPKFQRRRGALVGPNEGLTKLQSVIQGTSAVPPPSVGAAATLPLHQQERASKEGQEKVRGARGYVLCCVLNALFKGLCLWRKVNFNDT
eukprot:1154322-Pelagomonas_calceolata.AAC.2